MNYRHCPLIAYSAPRAVPVLNVSCRKVGGIAFLKIGRFCFSFCLTRHYRAL